jgi:hypothetical protein
VNGAALHAISGPNLKFGNEFRIVVRGDFIRDRNGKGLDADHLPPWLPSRHSGDEVEGGTFESWFTLA